MQFCKLISYDTKRVHAVGKLELDPSVLTLMVNWLGNKKSKNYYISSISPGALFYCFLRLMSLEQSKLFKTYQKTFLISGITLNRCTWWEWKVFPSLCANIATMKDWLHALHFLLCFHEAIKDALREFFPNWFENSFIKTYIAFTL